MKSAGANGGFVQRPGGTSILTVPTADPFLRRKNLDDENQMTRKVLNPGSCASAMDLLALAQAGSIGSMQSLHRAMTTVLNPDSQPRGSTSIVAVPTADPFLRKKSLHEEIQRTSTKRVRLNPGSCASAMDLLALAQAGSIGSMQSLHRAMTTALNPNSQQQDSTSIIAVPTADPFLRKKNLDEEGRRTSTRKVLNPGSCASAMDLLALAHAGSIGSICASGLDLLNGLQGRGSRRGSMASVSSAVSDASQLLRAIQGNVSQSSLFSASANGFALLLGDFPAPVQSSSSPRGRGSSKNNARICRRAKDPASNGNKNADWDVFE